MRTREAVVKVLGQEEGEVRASGGGKIDCCW